MTWDNPVNRVVVTCPNLQKQFNVIEEHCVIFHANFVIDDQVGSRIINVIQNILL